MVHIPDIAGWRDEVFFLMFPYVDEIHGLTSKIVELEIYKSMKLS